ncbi:ankyrin repeat protein [Rhypophila decipiens]
MNLVMPSQLDPAPTTTTNQSADKTILARTSQGDKLDAKERKRLQNRLAQRTYRQNQKQRLRLLERAIEQVTSKSLTLNLDANTVTTAPTDTLQQTCNALQAWSDTNTTAAAATAVMTPSPVLHVPENTNTHVESWDMNLVFSPLLDDVGGAAEQPEPDVRPHTSGGGARTALHLAVSSENESLARVLLQHGADTERRDSHGQAALHMAARLGSRTMVQLLLEDAWMATVDSRDNLGRTALFPAVLSGSEAVVKLLLDAPASLDPNSADVMGNVPLHLAVETGSEAITLLLLNAGANVDA